MILRLPNPLSALVWAAFLLPAFFPGERADFWLGAAVLPLALLLDYFQPSSWEARRPAAAAVKLFALMEGAWLLSYGYSAAFNGVDPALRDLARLPRYAFEGAFIAWLLRHYDARVRSATHAALGALPYLSLVLPGLDPFGFLSALAFSRAVFSSKEPLWPAHAAAALLALGLHGGPAAWGAAALAAGWALAVHLKKEHKKQVRAAAASALAACAAWALRGGPSGTWALLKASPLLGWGPSVYESLPPGLGQLSLWLVTGGVTLFALCAAGLALAAWAALAAAPDRRRRAQAASMLAGAALLALAAPVLETYRLFFAAAFALATTRGDA